MYLDHTLQITNLEWLIWEYQSSLWYHWGSIWYHLGSLRVHKAY